MHMRAGRKAGRADIADHLALADAGARLRRARECGHVAVGGLVAVGMTDAHVFAVAAFPADLVDGAVAGGVDRGAERGGPVDAGVHLEIAEQRMIAGAEAGPHDSGRHRLAHQELLRALSGLVVVVDDAVVGGLELVVLLGLAAGGQRGEHHVVLVVLAVQHVEGIARLRLVLEVDVVGIDADQRLDHRFRHVVAERGLVDALVEPHALAVILVVVAGVGNKRVHAGDVDRDVFAHVGQRHHRVDRAVAHHDDADRLLTPGDRGGDQDTELLAFLQSVEAAARTERRSDRRDFVRRAPDLLENGGDGVALLHRDGALVPAVAAGGLGAGLGQKRDVLGDDARLKARVGIGRTVGGIGERCAAAGRQARDLITVLRAGRPIGGVAHARDDVVDRQRGCDLCLRQDAGEVARHIGDFGVGLGARLFVDRHAIGAGDCQKLLRVEGRHARGKFRARHRQVG